MKTITRSAVELIADGRLQHADKGYELSFIVVLAGKQLPGIDPCSNDAVADLHQHICLGGKPLGVCGIALESKAGIKQEVHVRAIPFREHEGDTEVHAYLLRFANEQAAIFQRRRSTCH